PLPTIFLFSLLDFSNTFLSAVTEILNSAARLLNDIVTTPLQACGFIYSIRSFSRSSAWEYLRSCRDFLCLHQWLKALDLYFLFTQEFIILSIYSRLRSEEHTSELQSRFELVCRLLL